MENVAKVSGRNNIAVIKKDNSLWVWGANNVGQLGDGTKESRNVPQKILDDVIDVTAYSGNTIALKRDGTLWGCGTNSCGELGIGDYGIDCSTSLIKIMDNIAILGIIYHIPSTWARDDVKKATKLELVPSQLQSFYENSITRGEFVSLISRLLYKATNKNLNMLAAEKDKQENIVFSDTKDEDIINIAKLGLIEGIGNSKFNPDGALTREQAAKILMKTSNMLGLLSKNSKTDFEDKNKNSKWAVEGIDFCYSYGIMNGTGNNNFSPQKTYSREMSIVTILRLYNLVTQKTD